MNMVWMQCITSSQFPQYLKFFNNTNYLIYSTTLNDPVLQYHEGELSYAIDSYLSLLHWELYKTITYIVS
jgi:hypothetical protein